MDRFLEDGLKNPVKIQDNTFRDGHQSLLATRMRTEDMLPKTMEDIRKEDSAMAEAIEKVCATV